MIFFVEQSSNVTLSYMEPTNPPYPKDAAIGVQSAGNRHGAAAAISQPCKSVDEVFERSERKEPDHSTQYSVN